MAAQIERNQIQHAWYEREKVPKFTWFPVLHLLIKCLVTKLRTNRSVHQVLLYVNSTEKWTGMKNTGLKIPVKDQLYV